MINRTNNVSSAKNYIHVVTSTRIIVYLLLIFLIRSTAFQSICPTSSKIILSRSFTRGRTSDGNRSPLGRLICDESSGLCHIPPLYMVAGNNGIDESDDNYVKPTGVTLKMAFDQSHLWGVYDMSSEKSERFTSPRSLDLVHRLRRVSDVVLVGRKTVELDDCTLTVRRVPTKRKQPTRVVLDSNLKILSSSPQDVKKDHFTMLKDGLPLIIYHSVGADLNIDKFLSKNNRDDDGVENTDNIILVHIPSNDDDDDSSGGISPKFILKDLMSRNLNHIMVEGGPQIARSFLSEKIVDRAIIIKAPITFKEPVPSYINEEILSEAGLEKINCKSSTEDDNDDTVEFWSRPGLPWPSENWP